MPYATVIVGATPIKLTVFTGGAIISNEGALPTMLMLLLVLKSC
jgi:hypothetical protein